MRINYFSEDLKNLEIIREPFSPAKDGIEDCFLSSQHEAFTYQSREISWDGLRLHSASICVNRPIKLTASSMGIGFAMHFQVSGTGSSSVDFCDRNFELIPEKHFIIKCPEKTITEMVKVAQDVRVFQVNMSHAWYKERIAACIGENIEDITLKKVKDGRVSPNMVRIIKEMMDCPYQGATQKLFLEGKVLELLSLQLESYSHSMEKNTLNTYDVEALNYARKIIEKNFSDSLSLKDLALNVGINEFKLKKGFKSLFGTSVHAYLISIRMEKALLLIEEGFQVSEVCELVGYKNNSHFIQAFKNKFGHTPGSVKASGKKIARPHAACKTQFLNS